MKVTFTLNKKKQTIEASVTAMKAALSEAINTNEEFWRNVVLPVAGQHLAATAAKYAEEHPEILEKNRHGGSC